MIIRVSRLLANPDANQVFTELSTAFRMTVTTLTGYFDYLLTAVSGLRFYGMLGLLVWRLVSPKRWYQTTDAD